MNLEGIYRPISIADHDEQEEEVHTYKTRVHAPGESNFESELTYTNVICM